MTITRDSLKASHPVRSMTAFLFSTFHKHICDSVEKSLVVAKEAYNEGISSLSDLDSSLHHDAMHNLKVLREHIEELS